jgi:hypothetical protein
MMCLYSVEKRLLTFTGKDTLTVQACLVPTCPNLLADTHKISGFSRKKSYNYALFSLERIYSYYCACYQLPATSSSLLPYPCFQLPIPYSLLHNHILCYPASLFPYFLLLTPYYILHTPYRYYGTYGTPYRYWYIPSITY